MNGLKQEQHGIKIWIKFYLFIPILCIFMLVSLQAAQQSISFKESLEGWTTERDQFWEHTTEKIERISSLTGIEPSTSCFCGVHASIDRFEPPAVRHSLHNVEKEKIHPRKDMNPVKKYWSKHFSYLDPLKVRRLCPKKTVTYCKNGSILCLQDCSAPADHHRMSAEGQSGEEGARGRRQRPQPKVTRL